MTLMGWQQHTPDSIRPSRGIQATFSVSPRPHGRPLLRATTAVAPLSLTVFFGPQSFIDIKTILSNCSISVKICQSVYACRLGFRAPNKSVRQAKAASNSELGSGTEAPATTPLQLLAIRVASVSFTYPSSSKSPASRSTFFTRLFSHILMVPNCRR